ncbi:MAG: acetylxylan esterase [Planctomycetota bacterium]|nr:acetylxylan esterase [Planctomycetota bacterium]
MNPNMWEYLCELGRRMSSQALADINSLEKWKTVREERKHEFFGMLGLADLPARGELSPQVSGTTQGEGYSIRRLSIQSLPGVHVNCNLYIPDGLEGPGPAVLYVCGHGMIGTQHYQAQGDLWARRGYVLLALDTLEQGDSRGDHHGIYYETEMDWINRGYTSSGGELWNSLRALDYLCSLVEVDEERIGVTGISGGGALSWWVGAADERVKAIAPVCGTSTMTSHIAERTVNGHCDCMLYLNLHQREMSEIGALCAPRPLLVGCAREDSLFHPDAYRLVVEQTRKIYSFYGKGELCTLCEYPGPHSYSKKVHDAIQRLFDQHVAGDERPILDIEEPKFAEKELTVAGGAPPPNDRIELLPTLLSTRGRTPHKDSIEEWEVARKEKVEELRQQVFRHFPCSPEPLDLSVVGNWEFGGGVRVWIRDFTTEDGIRLRMRLYLPPEDPESILLGVMNPDQNEVQFQRVVMAIASGKGAATIEPRGTGPTSWHSSFDWQFTRAALLVGRTTASMQVWDVLRAAKAIGTAEDFGTKNIYTYGSGDAGVVALYAAVLDEDIAGALADDPPASHAKGPHLMNVLRVVDLPEAAGLIAPRQLGLVNAPLRTFHWTERLYGRLGISERLVKGAYARDVYRNMLEGAL